MEAAELKNSSDVITYRYRGNGLTLMAISEFLWLKFEINMCYNAVKI